METKFPEERFEIVPIESIDSTDNPDDFYYHVTTRPRQILKSGLKPNQKPSMDSGFYRNYSAGKVFFCERPGVPFWLWRIGDILEARFDMPPKLSVVRFPKSMVANAQEDGPGTKDSHVPCYFVTQPIVATRAKLKEQIEWAKAKLESLKRRIV